MKRRTLLQTLTVGAALLLLLTSCKGGNGTTDDTTGKGTTAETEAATAIPRYDYMDATVAPDVSIKREDYTNLSLTIPNSPKRPSLFTPSTKALRTGRAPAAIPQVAIPTTIRISPLDLRRTTLSCILAFMAFSSSSDFMVLILSIK